MHCLRSVKAYRKFNKPIFIGCVLSMKCVLKEKESSYEKESSSSAFVMADGVLSIDNFLRE